MSEFPIEKVLTSETTKNLLVKSLEENIISKTTFNTIITRATDEKKFELKVFNDEKLEEISKKIPEIDRANNIFGRRNSHFSELVLTLSHITPQRNLRQILAEVENRRSALKDSYFKLKKSFIKLVRKLKEYEEVSRKEDNDEKILKLVELKVDIESIESGIVDSRLYIEGALKEVFILQKAYDDITETFSLENWDEEDFEKAEIEYNIKRAITQSIRDVRQSGTIGTGNQEYLEMCGIDPYYVCVEVKAFLKQQEETIKKAVEEKKNIKGDTKQLTDFVNYMFYKYKFCVNKVLELRGIKSSYIKEAMYLERSSE